MRRSPCTVPPAGKAAARRRGRVRGPILLLLCALLCAALPESCPARVIWVAPWGEDGASGDESSPLRTIQRGADLATPGDTIRVRSGTYSEWIRFDHGGAPGSPIVLESAAPETARVAAPAPGGDAFSLRSGVHDLRIRSFRVEGPFDRGFRVDPGVERVAISGVRVEGPRNGIHLRGVDSVRIGGALLIGTGPGTGLTSDATPSSRIRVHDCTARGYDGGNGCEGDSDGFVAVGDDFVFERCRAMDCSEDGFDLKASGVAMRDCEASGCCNGAKLWYGASVARSRFHHNRWYGLAIAGLRGEACLVDHVSSWDNAASALEIDGLPETRVEVCNSVLSNSGAAIGLRVPLDLREDRNTLWHPDEERGLIWVAEGADSLWFGRDAIQAGVWYRRAGGRWTEAADPRLLPDGSLAEGSPCIDSADPDEPPPGNGGWFADRGALETEEPDPHPGSPGPPAAVEASAGWGWLDCAWTPPPDPDLAGFEIQLRSAPHGEWNLLARVGRVDRLRASVGPTTIRAEVRLRAVDIAGEASSWTDPVQARLRADLDGDGEVGEQDLALFASMYGSRFGDAGWDPRGDLNIDGIVDALDMAGFSTAYEPTDRQGSR